MPSWAESVPITPAKPGWGTNVCSCEERCVSKCAVMIHHLAVKRLTLVYPVHLIYTGGKFTLSRTLTYLPHQNFAQCFKVLRRWFVREPSVTECLRHQCYFGPDNIGAELGLACVIVCKHQDCCKGSGLTKMNADAKAGRSRILTCTSVRKLLASKLSNAGSLAESPRSRPLQHSEQSSKGRRAFARASRRSRCAANAATQGRTYM